MVRAIFLLAVLFALAAPADAQSRRELAARLDAAEARIAELEAEAEGGDPFLERLLGRLDALEREQRVLTGEIERLAFENRRMRTELEQMGRNVDALLAGRPAPGEGGDGPALLESNEIDPNDPFAELRANDVRPLQPPGQAGTAANPNDAGNRAGAVSASDSPAGLSGDPAAEVDPDALFSDGRARLLDGDFFGARESFEDYTTQFPEGDRAGEAWYWLGETYFVSSAFEDAADAYIASLRADRRGPRGPDALVRLAASLDALGQTGRACDVLATFPQEFPNAGEEARRKAQREVSRIGCN